MRCFIAAAVLSAAVSSASASSLTFGQAANYNAFILGDFTETNTDSVGAIAVGRNFAPANNGTFTIASGHAVDGAGVFDLVVAGNFNDQYGSLGGGSAFVGGNMTWTDPTLPRNLYVGSNFDNPANGGSIGGTVYYYGSYSSGTALSHSKLASQYADPIDFAAAKTNLDSLSAALAAQAPNGSVSSSYNTYTLTGTDPTLNVFDLTGANYSSATINITSPAGSTVVINVASANSSSSFSGGSINLNGISASNVIWNFSGAQSVSIAALAFNGTLLAPDAAFTGAWGQLNGQLIAASAAGTTELHDALFSGALPIISNSSSIPQAPEPGTWVMLLSGAGLIVLARFRSSRG
jgi:choice-of-anchor A domain-containing protein